MNKLIIHENPVLLLIPSLALKIGLHEAVILQQIHYRLQSSKNFIEGKKWIYNTYKEWQSQVPFWSESTIKRTIYSLEEKGLLISANWNQLKMDKTKWYTIDYSVLEELDVDFNQSESSLEEMDLPMEADLSIDDVDIEEALPKDF